MLMSATDMPKEPHRVPDRIRNFDPLASSQP
jgi:hypothetical protein